MNVVCVFAHQDDEMRCLGTLLRLAESGASIAFVCVSNGDRGLAFAEADARSRAAEVRDQEMRAVAAEFGGAYACLNYPDSGVYDTPQLRAQLITALRRMNAELVFTHWVNDYNPDHVATARAITDAALFTNLPSFEPDVPALSAVPRIFYTNPGDGYAFEGTHFVALSPDHQRLKTELIRRHTSQMAVMRELRGHDYADEMIDEDRRQGRRLMTEFAESFRPCLAERRIPWPSDLPGARADTAVDPS